jgi:hypothetical protein
MPITTTLPDGDYTFVIRLTREVTLSVVGGEVAEQVIEDERDPSIDAAFATGPDNSAVDRPTADELHRVASAVWSEGLE